MDSDVEKLSWWSTTTRLLFSPQTFFAQVSEPFRYRRSAVYLAKTAFLASLLSALVLAAIFYFIVVSFVSILTAFMVLFGVLLTPLIAVAANIPPDKVPAVIESLARGGGTQVGLISAKLGAFLFCACFATIVVGTYLQAVIAHGIARLMGCAGGFRATVAAYSLGSAAWMLCVVPFANVIAPVYAVVLYTFGMKSGHRLSGLKATLAVAMAAAVPMIVLLACTVRSD